MNALSKYRLSMVAMLATVLAATFGPSAAHAQASNQVALVSISSLEEIAKDVDFVAQLIDQPMVSKQFAMMTMMFTQSLDKTKPIGIAVFAEGENLSVLAMLPVTDTAQLLDLLKNLQIPVQQGNDDAMEITIQGQTIHAKAQNGWVFAAQKAEHLASAPADPSKLISTLTDTYDLGARIYVQNIPANLRDMAISGLKDGLEKGLEREENESDEQYEIRKTLTLKQIENFEQALQEMDELTIGWSLDSKESKTFFDFAFTAVDDTKLAKQIGAYAEAKTDYAGFLQPDAAAMLSFSSVMTEEEIEQATEMLAGLRTQIMNQVDNQADLPDEKAKEVVKNALGDFWDAFIATLKDGKADGGAVILLAPEAMTLVAGGRCTEPDKVINGLKKLEALAEDEPDFPGIQWDADRHGDISFHTLRIPIPDNDPEAQKAKVFFGEELDVALGTGENSIYFALGRDAVAKCKEIIDKCKASPGKAVTPMELSIALGQIMTTIAAIETDPVVKKIAEDLQNSADGLDHLRMTAKVIDRGVKYQLEVEKGVLQALGTAVKMKQGGK